MPLFLLAALLCSAAVALGDSKALSEVVVQAEFGQLVHGQRREILGPANGGAAAVEQPRSTLSLAYDVDLSRDAEFAALFPKRSWGSIGGISTRSMDASAAAASGGLTRTRSSRRLSDWMITGLFRRSEPMEGSHNEEEEEALRAKSVHPDGRVEGRKGRSWSSKQGGGQQGSCLLRTLRAMGRVWEALESFNARTAYSCSMSFMSAALL